MFNSNVHAQFERHWQVAMRLQNQSSNPTALDYLSGCSVLMDLYNVTAIEPALHCESLISQLL